VNAIDAWALWTMSQAPAGLTVPELQDAFWAEFRAHLTTDDPAVIARVEEQLRARGLNVEGLVAKMCQDSVGSSIWEGIGVDLSAELHGWSPPETE